MKITELRDHIAAMEGGKVNLSIAQISEVLRCLNTISGGAFYKWVHASHPLMEMAKVTKR